MPFDATPHPETVESAEEAEAEREEAEDLRRANPLEPDFRRL